MEIKARIGCYGFLVGKSRYYERFSVVELQKTFYQPSQLTTVKKWRGEAMKKAKGYKDTVRKGE
jgi:uncharacterized protein YecE (DUF72 family)